MPAIRLELPLHLRRLAAIRGSEISVTVEEPVTINRTLEALETRFPMLQGTIRDHNTRERGAFLRYFVCNEDWSHGQADCPLPEAVLKGREPLIVLGAISGGSS